MAEFAKAFVASPCKVVDPFNRIKWASDMTMLALVMAFKVDLDTSVCYMSEPAVLSERYSCNGNAWQGTLVRLIYTSDHYLVGLRDQVCHQHSISIVITFSPPYHCDQQHSRHLAGSSTCEQWYTT